MTHHTAEAAAGSTTPLSIGEVSERLGITAHTARYYDRIGLVRQGESTTTQRLEIMLAQRRRILTQIVQLEHALAATDFKIAAYGGGPGGDRVTRRPS